MRSDERITVEADEHRALALMCESLDLLDRAGVPAHIGAHLDLAIERLREHLGATIVHLEAIRARE